MPHKQAACHITFTFFAQSVSSVLVFQIDTRYRKMPFNLSKYSVIHRMTILEALKGPRDTFRISLSATAHRRNPNTSLLHH